MMYKGSAIVAAAALALAGCGNNQGEGPIKPDIYNTVEPSGNVGRLNVRADGTFHDIDDMGRGTDSGTWSRKDGKFCLDSQTNGEVCFEEKAGANGAITLTYQGQVFTLTPASAPR